ncbi:MAG TPA: MraY family glycosyltransferase [Panacibacter sp.]|nr:MraY family glycosyltransferase [Panacibacter sp.]
MVLVAAGMFIAYLVTFILMPFIIKIARINKLFDIPDERKTHTYPISSLGGIGIVAGLSISLLLVSDFKLGDSEFQYYLAAFFIIFILGVIDDIFVLHAWKKVMGQILVSLILTAKAHLIISNLQGLGGIFEISNIFSYPLTFFAIILVINSFNLMDGVDGLAASVGLVASFAFGLFFYINNNLPYAILSFAMAGSLLAFLMFNFPPAKIFMGDSGSMLIGLVNAILLIKFIETAGSVPLFPVASSIAVGFGILVIPLLDVLRVFIIRLTKGVSPFEPDRNHLHHLLLNKGFSHTKVTITLMIAAALLSAFSFFIQSLDINLIAVILSALFFAGVFVIKYFAPPQRHLHVVGQNEIVSTNNLQDTKVLSLYRTKENVVVKEE